MQDSEKIRIMAKRLLREFGYTYRCDDMSDYSAPPEDGLIFDKLGFYIIDNNRYITIKYRDYIVYDESMNRLLTNEPAIKGWMDTLADLYNDIPEARRRIESENDFKKSVSRFSTDYLEKIRRDCWISDRTQLILTLTDGPGYQMYNNYKVYYDKKLVMHYRENGEIFAFVHGDWENEVVRFYENGCYASEEMKFREELDRKLNFLYNYTLSAIKEDTWISEHTKMKVYSTHEEPGESFINNYEAYTDGELVFQYKSVSRYTGRCLIYKPGRWEVDLKYYVEALRAGNVPENIREKNAREKELKRTLNGNKSYY